MGGGAFKLSTFSPKCDRQALDDLDSSSGTEKKKDLDTFDGCLLLLKCADTDLHTCSPNISQRYTPLPILSFTR